MKIALKKNGLLNLASVFLAALAFTMAMQSAAIAQTQVAPAPNPAPAAMPAAIPAPAPVAEAPKIVSPPADDQAAVSPTAAPEKEEKNSKGLSGAEDKIADSAKSVAKRLSATDSITLDDLNSARQAVAKIDALIDLEKKLNELDKLRSEHEGGSHGSLSGAIPASALAPLPTPAMPMQPVSMAPMPASIMQNAISPMNSMDVTRIIGSDGRFSAIVKTFDGQTKTVNVGDHVDGNVVTAITSSGVELEHNNSKHVVHVKNVQTVFGTTQ